MNTLAPDRFSTHARAVAGDLLGEPNKGLSSQHELRFGKQGSVSVDLRTGQFYDHEQKVGGGVLWAIETFAGRSMAGGDAVKWMTEKGYDVEETAPPPPAGRIEGRGDRPAQRRDADGNWIPDHVPEGAKLSRVYDYQNEKGALAYQVLRYDWDDPESAKGHGKTFLQRRPNERQPDRWIYKTKGMTQLPYRLPELIEDVAAGLPIFIVEGEKKVDMLRDIGVPATCNSGGSGKFATDLAPWFAGADVTIIPDNDDAGRKHVDVVAATLRGTAMSVRYLEIPGLPSKGSVDDWIPAGGTAEELYDLRETEARAWAPKPPEKSRFVILGYAEIFRDAKPLEPLVKGILTRNEISLLAGPSQSGKSFLALDLAMSVARGVPFFGRKTRQGGVIYQAGESAAGLRRRRIPAYATHHGCDDHPIPFALAQGRVDLFGDDDPHAFAEECKLWGATFDHPLALIVIDTLNRATPGMNENDGKDMSRVLDHCEYIRRETGAHVMLVHHMNAGGQKPRGHTSLFAAVDSTIIARKLENEEGDPLLDVNGRQVREWSISKMKEGDDGITGRFVLPKVLLGHDEDDDEITSCVVAKPGATDEDGAGRKGAKSVSGPTKLVLRAIYDLVRDEGRVAPSSMELPSTVRVVDRKAVAERLKEIMAPASAEEVEQRTGESIEDARRRLQETRRKAGERGRDALYAAGIIGINDDLVWLTGIDVIGFGPAPGTRQRRADRDASDDHGAAGDGADHLPFDAGDFR